MACYLVVFSSLHSFIHSFTHPFFLLLFLLPFPILILILIFTAIALFSDVVTQPLLQPDGGPPSVNSLICRFGSLLPFAPSVFVLP